MPCNLVGVHQHLQGHTAFIFSIEEYAKQTKLQPLCLPNLLFNREDGGSMYIKVHHIIYQMSVLFIGIAVRI